MAIRSRFKRRMASCHSPVDAVVGSAVSGFLLVTLVTQPDDESQIT